MPRTTCFLLLLLSARLDAQSLPIKCAGYDFFYTWRINVAVTDSTPAPIAADRIYTIINTDGGLWIEKSGESMPGTVEGSTLSAKWSTFSEPNPEAYGGRAPGCTLGFKSYSLLQSTAGIPMGSRTTRYTMKINPENGSVTGKVQYESRALDGTLLNTANGTFTGGLVGKFTDEIDNDPYWDDSRGPTGCVRFPSSFVPFASVYYLSQRNSSGDRLLLGNTLQPDAVDPLINYRAIQSLPLPVVDNQEFCAMISLAPGYTVFAYLPTSAERNGDLSKFGVTLTDPETKQLIPGNIIPIGRLPSLFAWRVPAQPPVLPASRPRPKAMTPARKP